MQIHLKQKEIVEALKVFITQQGINLTGKTVEVEFTSGRKDNGLSVEMTIEDTIYVPDVSTGPAPLSAETPAVTEEQAAPKPSLFGTK